MLGKSKITELEIPKVILLEGLGGEDERGQSAKFFSREALKTVEIDFTPLEILSIRSNENVLRGIHFQKQYRQSRAISCIRGELFVAVVDLNQGSRFFGKWCSVILNRPSQLLYVPSDCAVGSFAMKQTDFICMFGENSFIVGDDSGIIWNDKEIAIDWPKEVKNVIISEKDRNWPAFKQVENMMKREKGILKQ